MANVDMTGYYAQALEHKFKTAPVRIRCSCRSASERLLITRPKRKELVARARRQHSWYGAKSASLDGGYLGDAIADIDDNKLSMYIH